jgi:hypothetical protein
MTIEKLILEDFNNFGGKHCQTTALKAILDYHGFNLSEEMLFGLGGGISFIYWYMKNMPYPMVGGRFGGKHEEFLTNICKRIGGDASLFQTTSAKKGYTELKNMLRTGEPVYPYVDMAYLPYMAIPEDAHFGGHTIVVFGIDEEINTAYIGDRGKAPVTTTIDDLKKARSSKFPPFPPQNKILKIEYPSQIADLHPGIYEALFDCCDSLLNPPIRNFGLKGIKKWAKMVLKWPEQFKGLNFIGCLMNTFIFIEIGGTGGSAFRPMFAQYLKEAHSIVNNNRLLEVADVYEETGDIWSQIAELTLPDSWPALKRIRELSLEKNDIFEAQSAGTLQKMLKINEEVNECLKEAEKELEKKDVSSLCLALHEKILELHKKETQAAHMLQDAIAES